MVIDWAAIGAIITAVVAVITLIIKFWPKPWLVQISSLEKDNSVLQTKIESIEKEIDSLTTSLVQESERNDKNIHHMNQKIEKITDLMIRMIQDTSK